MMTDRVELWANILLFLSSLLLLIDVAPRDLLPSHRRLVKAIARLRDKRNIIGPLPPGVNLQPGGQLQMTQDEATYRILVPFVRKRSSRASGVDWNRAIAIGYSVVSVPVAGSTLDAIRPLYVALTPQGAQQDLDLVPVGVLEDLDKWLREWRQGNLTKTAFLLLAAGFLFQLLPTVCSLWIAGSP